MLYYKIIFKTPPEIGTIIDASKNYDIQRIKRFSKLNKLFNLFFHISSSKNISLHKILSLLYPNRFYSNEIINNEEQLKRQIQVIEREILTVNFTLSEFRWFTDYVLCEAKRELEINFNSILPDRFKSHYFFETLEDCLNYHDQLYLDGMIVSSKSTVIQVEFLNNHKIHKMDNTFLRDFQNHFTSLDFYNSAKRFLNKEVSENPLYEIIYEGEYRIKTHSLTI